MKTVLFAILMMIAWMSPAIGQTPNYQRSLSTHWRNAYSGLVIDVWNWPEDQGGRLLDGEGYAKFYVGTLGHPTHGTLVQGPLENIQETVDPSLGRGDERVYKVIYQSAPTSLFVDTFLVFIGNYGGGDELLQITLTLTNSPPTTGDLTLANPVAWSSGPVAIPIISVASDPNDDPLIFARTIDTQPAGCGVITWDNVFKIGYFTPTNGMLGLCEIQYKVRDEFHESNTATLTVQVINTAPVVANVVLSANPGTPVQIDVLAGASDPEGNPMTFVSSTPPTPAGCGDAMWDASEHHFDFISFVGGTACQWNYTLTDSIASSTGSVTVNVAPELILRDGFE